MLSRQDKTTPHGDMAVTSSLPSAESLLASQQQAALTQHTHIAQPSTASSPSSM